MESQYIRITHVLTKNSFVLQQQQRKKTIKQKRREYILDILQDKTDYEVKVMVLQRTGRHPQLQSAASERRKELLSSDIYLSGNFSLFVYCMTEILLVLALSRLLIMSDSQTSSIVVPNHCYKPDPSPVCSKAQQPRRPPAALRRFIGFCSSSYCTEMGIFSQLIKFSFRW